LNFSSLLSLRKAGKRPDQPIVLSLCGNLLIDACYSVPENPSNLDLRCLHNLTVVIVGTDRQTKKVVRYCQAIDDLWKNYKLFPEEVFAWNIETGKWTFMYDWGIFVCEHTWPLQEYCCFSEDAVSEINIRRYGF
jgi:hypothetical protein